jgi:hypothetical protein
MATRHAGKVFTIGTGKPQNLQVYASLAQLNCQQLRMHAPPMRALRIQYP